MSLMNCSAQLRRLNNVNWTIADDDVLELVFCSRCKKRKALQILWLNNFSCLELLDFLLDILWCVIKFLFLRKFRACLQAMNVGSKSACHTRVRD